MYIKRFSLFTQTCCSIILEIKVNVILSRVSSSLYLEVRSVTHSPAVLTQLGAHELQIKDWNNNNNKRNEKEEEKKGRNKRRRMEEQK